MLSTPSTAAIWFLICLFPILAWVMWSDMKDMRIPNKAVLAMVAVFLIVGPFVLPLAEWGWRWTHLVVMLIATFLLTQIGAMGAGDAKFLAAAAPFVALADYGVILLLLAAIIPASFVTHRLFRAIPAVRRATTDWKSWDRPTDFPMGLPYAGVLVFYLILAATR